MSDKQSITISAKTSSGQPLEVLQQLIQKRAAVMNQTTAQCCVAITIQVLKSLRALTRKSNGKLKPFIENEPTTNLDIQIKERKDLFVSFIRNKGKIVKPCVRVGSKHGDVFIGKVWWRSGVPKPCLVGMKVYQTTLSTSRAEAWHKKVNGYIVATSIDEAKKWLAWRFERTVKKSSTLAKSALSRAMVLTNDKPINIQNTARQNVLTNNVFVDKNLASGNSIGSQGYYSITVSDNLNYATQAMKGGESAINTAMAKASNSVNAVINNYIESNTSDNWFSSSEWETAESPFPKEYFESN